MQYKRNSPDDEIFPRGYTPLELYVCSITMSSHAIGDRQRIYSLRSVGGAGALSPLALGAFYLLRE